MRGHDPIEVRVHHLDQARAVLRVADEFGCAVRLRSAQGSAGFAGVGFWHAIAEAIGQDVVVDCGDDAGLVLAALRTGCREIAYDGPAETASRLTEIAHRTGARLHASPPPRALDLAFDDGPDEIRHRLGLSSAI